MPQLLGLPSQTSQVLICHVYDAAQFLASGVGDLAISFTSTELCYVFIPSPICFFLIVFVFHEPLQLPRHVFDIQAWRCWSETFSSCYYRIVDIVIPNKALWDIICDLAASEKVDARFHASRWKPLQDIRCWAQQWG